jgi:hypothetical protein
MSDLDHKWRSQQGECLVNASSGIVEEDVTYIAHRRSGGRLPIKTANEDLFIHTPTTTDEVGSE